MKRYLQLIDRETTGNRCDVTPLFADPAAFSEMLDDLLDLTASVEFDFVLGVDALGFILGTGLALRSRRGLVVARKGGKLPVAANSVSFVDYTGQSKALELRKDALPKGARVLIADEWVETGAQVKAVIQLVQDAGAAVAGIVAIKINPDADPALREYPCFKLMP